MTPTVTVTTPPHTVRPVQPDIAVEVPGFGLVAVLVVVAVWRWRHGQKRPYRHPKETP